METTTPAPESNDLSTLIEVYELDARRRSGVDVFLYWYKNTNTLAMTLNDGPEQKTYHFEVPNDKGLHALVHPFWYQFISKAPGYPLIPGVSTT